jgi:hypothetical protein
LDDLSQKGGKNISKLDKAMNNTSSTFDNYDKDDLVSMGIFNLNVKKTNIRLKNHESRLDDHENDIKLLKQVSSPSTPDGTGNGLIDVLKDMIKVLKIELLGKVKNLDQKTTGKDTDLENMIKKITSKLRETEKQWNKLNKNKEKKIKSDDDDDLPKEDMEGVDSIIDERFPTPDDERDSSDDQENDVSDDGEGDEEVTQKDNTSD